MRCSMPTESRPTRSVGSTCRPNCFDRSRVFSIWAAWSISPFDDDFHAEEDIVGDRQRGNQLEVLMHHAEAGRDGDGRVGKHRLLAVDPDLAFVGLQQAEQYVHQRRLAGAILADDGVDLAALDGEVDAVIGDERTETLGDRFQLDGEGHRGSGLWSDGIVLPPSSDWKRTGAAPEHALF